MNSLVAQYRRNYPDLTPEEESQIRRHVMHGENLFFRCRMDAGDNSPRDVAPADQTCQNDATSEAPSDLSARTRPGPSSAPQPPVPGAATELPK